MSNFFTDNEDLKYYFERGIDWEPLVRLTEYDYRSEGGFKSAAEAVATYRQIIEMVGDFVATEVAPYAAEMDREGARMEGGECHYPDRYNEIFEQIKGLELHGMCVPRELGGMSCPMMLTMITYELFARADASVMTHFGFHGGMAMALLLYSILEGTTEFDEEHACIKSTRFQTAIEEIISGEQWGCMDITEPDAGSDMAALRCVGEQDEDGRWYVTGQKIFITSGHGKYHFVIARTEKTKDPNNPMAGLQGLSMFLVPGFEDGDDGERKRFIVVDRIEEKLGHHASITTSLTFDRSPAQLIGQRGDGFKLMLTLMNNARVGVGFEAAGACEAAYRLAKEYAAERRSMGKAIANHEMIADYLDEMRTDIQAIRAIAMHGAYHEELAAKLDILLRFFAPADEVQRKSLEKQRRQHMHASRRATPLLKYFGAEKAVQMARRAIQILGGNGYTREFGAEKLLRDSVVLPIYEGTSQIQALMAMKDTLTGIMKNPQAFLKRQAQARWRSLSAVDPLERRVAKIQVLAAGAQNHLMTRTAADKLRSVQHKPLTEWPEAFVKSWDPKRDFAYAMLHAERLTQLLCDELAAELLWEQARRHPERREVLERFLERAETRSRFLHDEITTTGDRLLRQLSADDEATAQAS